MPPRFRLITFDAYNTLFKPRGSLSAQYAKEAAKYGMHVSKSAVSQHFGLAYKQQLIKAPFYGRNQGLTSRQWWQELVYCTFIGAGVSRKDLDPVFDKLFDALYTRFMTSEGYAVFPDVVSTLAEIKRHGYITGIISNSDERLLSVMKNLDLSKYFDFILPSCLAGYEKPTLEIFERARFMAGPDILPQQALHIGDDQDKDYEGARNAGWHAILLERSKLSYQESAPPVTTDSSQIPHTIMSLHDLCPLVLQPSIRSGSNDACSKDIADDEKTLAGHTV